MAPEQLLKTAGNDDLVITSKGKAVALLLKVAESSIDSTQSLVRSVRALQAQSALQREATVNGTVGISESDIDREILAARRGRRRK